MVGRHIGDRRDTSAASSAIHAVNCGAGGGQIPHLLRNSPRSASAVDVFHRCLHAFVQRLECVRLEVNLIAR